MERATIVTLEGSGDDVERGLWDALDMDGLRDQMTSGETAGVQMPMRTGHTVNACYMCGNSARTNAGLVCC